MAEPVLNAESIIKGLRGEFCRDASRYELLQFAATKIREAGPPYTSVYMYMLERDSDVLSLKAFDGRETEHTEIPIGKGLCGKAITTNSDLNIADVKAEPDYLACNLETRSELIVLIRRNQEILGQIDIDSDVPNGFDEEEEKALRRVADAIATLM